MTRCGAWFALFTLALLITGCTQVAVDEKGGGRYGLSVENDFMARVQGAEYVLGKKSEELCPDGYDRVKRSSTRRRHGGPNERIVWIIECS